MKEISHPEAPAEGFTQANDETAVYEVGFHVVPTVQETEVAAVAARLHAALLKAEGKIIEEIPPKKIQFAYRIERSVAGKREKYTEGYFGSIKFEAPREAIKPFEEMLRADHEILRFLLVHTTRESIVITPRAVFSSDRLEGETIAKPTVVTEEKHAEVSDEELNKSIDALVS